MQEYTRWHEGEGDSGKLHAAHSNVYQFTTTLDQTVREEPYSPQRMSLAYSSLQRNVELLAGENTWKFKIPLPAVMPPSLITSFGKIEYYVEAILPGHYSDRA
jgi:hypothetical protein